MCFRWYALGYVSKNVVKHGDIAPLKTTPEQNSHQENNGAYVRSCGTEGIDGQIQKPNGFETIPLDQNQSFFSMHMANDQDGWISNSILVLQASNRGLYLWHLRIVIRCATVYVHWGIITIK